MKFDKVVRKILYGSIGAMTPQEIRGIIKKDYPVYYGTPAHKRSVNWGHCKDIDHALLAQIYSLVGNSKTFICDKTYKPMKVSLQIEESINGFGRKNLEFQSKKYHTPKALKYELNVEDVLENADHYHQAYYQAEVFSGPSLYFHQRALATRNEPSSPKYLEYVYATLSAWGMHRMGSGGSKFQILKHSAGALKY